MKRKWLWFFGLLTLSVGTITALALNSPALGGNISGQRLERLEASSQYRDGAFVNIEPQASTKLTWDYLYEQFFGDQVRVPPSEIPVVPINPDDLSRPPTPGLRVIWIGHAGAMVEIDGQRLLFDPVFSEYASPVQFAGPKRFHPPPIALDDLDHIDGVIISHDHYDHLDMATTRHLATKGTQFFVPLGVGAHLEAWGVPDAQINEMDWWEAITLGAVTINSTPNRHYSGRGLTDYKATLWSSWSLIGTQHRVFYSGDTGYSKLFKEIGRRMGPFDLSIIKVGAYGPGASWVDVHMSPEDAVRVHLEIKGKQMLPVHWGTFNMGIHAWDEPIRRTTIAAKAQGVDLLTPRIGELVTVGEPIVSTRWWEAVGPTSD